MVARSHLLQIAPIAAEMRGAFDEGMRLERLGVIDYARTIVLPDGDFKGDTYDPGRHPAQLCLLQAIDTGATWVAVAKPVQDGGSLATSAPILRRAAHLHQTVIVAYPTQDKAKDSWTKKLWPMLEAQGGMEPKRGGGSRGGAARNANLPGGGWFLLRSPGGRGESGGASDTADALQLEEVDDWSDLRQLRRTERRISKSPDPLLLYVSTVKRDGTGAAGSLILRLVELGTGTRLHYPCIHCGAVQPFEWEQVDVEREVIRCMHCPEVMNEAQRQQALKHWSRHDTRATPLFSITWTALDSPFPIVVNGTRLPVLPGLCAEYKQALDAVAIGDHGLMRQFMRDRMTRVYTADFQTDEDATAPLTHAVLAERSRRAPWSAVGENKHDAGLWSRYWSEWPAAAEFAVPAIDVQHNRLYWSAVGFAADEQTWDIGWGTDYAHAGTDTDKPAPFAAGELTATLNRVADYMDEQLGDRMRLGVVDTGDLAAAFADELIEWLRNRPRWRACRGIDTLPRIRPDGDYQARIDGLVCWEKRWRPGLGRYVIGSEASWRTFQAGYRRAPGTRGAAHLPGPMKAGNTYLRHLTAKGERTLASGAVVFKEQPGGGRHDYGDARGYATAAGLALLRGDPAPPTDNDAPAAPAAPAHRTGGWMAGFGTSRL
jgi:hypothetical protein